MCDLKMFHIGEPPQLVSVYIREEWPPRVCPWGTHFCERVNAYKTIYITRATPSDRPTGLEIFIFLSLENVKLIN